MEHDILPVVVFLEIHAMSSGDVQQIELSGNSVLCD